MIRGSAGLRKLRWTAQGRGKRGGVRVIYYPYVPGDRIYLIYGYVKSEQTDLTPDQIKVRRRDSGSGSPGFAASARTGDCRRTVRRNL